MIDVSQELRERHTKKASGQSDTNLDLSALDARRIDLTQQPTKPVPVISLMGQQICTAGNLTVLSAQVKSGKSAVIGSMLAASMPVDESMTALPDLLGFTGQAHGGKAVVLFDTEQSPYDAWTLVHRAAARTGVQTLPENYRCYSTADLSVLQKRQLLAPEMERAAANCKGIHCVFIDGVADLCTNPNDPEEAFDLVGHLVQLAIQYQCPIILVLHENPSGLETGKTRGHLGSQLERKAESNLRVVKDASGVSKIYSERCRHAAISKDTGPRFAWDQNAQMHSTVLTDTKADRQEEKRKAALPEVDAAFNGVIGSIKWSELKKRIMESCHLKDRTADRRINEWLELKLITVSQGDYHRA